ncbi:MAG: hypothetical protein ACK6AD_13930 [Cyanobacteriota bacterium]|jgi:hypothetical protein
MVIPSPRAIRERLIHLALGLSILLALWLPGTRAQAASAPPAASPAWQQLRQELDSLQNQPGVYTSQQARRLADLSRLETAIDDPRQQPTVDNATAHNLGVFVRAKRQAPEQPATFAVLAAGHQTDDDVETVALFLPANVTVSWPGRPAESGATPARVVRLLPGQALRVRQAEGGTGYLLDLPAFSLETDSAELTALPSLRQEDIDTQPETAPVD